MSFPKIVDGRRFLIQQDWPLSLRSNTTDSVWTGYQEFGKKAEFGSVEFLHNKEKKCFTPKSSFCEATYSEEKLILKRNAIKTQCCFHQPINTWSQIHNGKQILSLDINSSGALGLSSDSDQYDAVIWNTRQANIECRLAGHLLDIYKCRFFPSGQVVLTGSGDTRLKIWSLPTGQCVRTCQGHTQGVEDIGFIGIGEKLLSVSRDGLCKVWECASGAETMTISPESGPLNSDGQGDNFRGRVAIGGEHGKGLVYCLASGNKIASVACSGPITSVLYEKESVVLMGCEDGFIHLFDLRNAGTALSVRKDERGSVLSMKQDNDGFILASFRDGSVCPVFNKTVHEFLVTPPFELSGPDCDYVPDFSVHSGNIYTACRDGAIRKYSYI